MAKRHKEALFIIDPGACNPTGVVHSMRRAVAEEGATEADFALRLMADQLRVIYGLEREDTVVSDHIVDDERQPFILILQDYLNRASFVRNSGESVLNDMYLQNLIRVICKRCKVFDDQIGALEFGSMIDACRAMCSEVSS